MTFPIPDQISYPITVHGETRVDPYFWMKERKNKKVIAHLKAENNYTDARLNPHADLKKLLYREMKSRMKEDDYSVPYFKNGYWYYSRYEKDEEFALYCRKKGSLDAVEEIVLDENELAANHDFYEIDSFSFTENNQILAFTEDLTGDGRYRIRFKDTTNETYLPFIIDHCDSEYTWHGDNETLYYILQEPDTLRPFQVKSFNIRTKETRDIYEEKDTAFSLTIDTTGNYNFIFLGCHSTQTVEFLFKSGRDYLEFESVLPRVPNHEYYPEISENEFFIKTNHEAQNFKLIRCPLTNRTIDGWEIIQPHHEDRLIEDFELFDAYLVVQEKEHGLDQIRVYNRTNFAHKMIPATEDTFSLFLENNPESNAKKVRIGYTSMTVPPSVYEIDLETFERVLIKKTEVLGEFNSEDYTSERVWANVTNDVNVPLSLVYRKSLFKKDGTNPILLYAYGAYGETIDPYFSTSRLSLLDRGFVVAIVHVRGGEYLGKKWYEDGKLLKKKNTFIDFIAATEFLIHEKYGHPKEIFGMGASAGGLLMGAVANMRPDLYKALILEVPFLDVVTTMLDETLPLTCGEYDEWGNPNLPEFYAYMLSYSPYDQITAQAYPALYITSGLNDTHVQFWEQAKYVAKLRSLKTDNNPVLLRTNLKAGHGGAAGRFEQLHEIAEIYTFILALHANELNG